MLVQPLMKTNSFRKIMVHTVKIFCQHAWTEWCAIGSKTGGDPICYKEDSIILEMLVQQFMLSSCLYGTKRAMNRGLI